MFWNKSENRWDPLLNKYSPFSDPIQARKKEMMKASWKLPMCLKLASSKPLKKNISNPWILKTTIKMKK